MARIRTIKPEFWSDSKTGSLSDRATKLFLGMLNFADDYGVLQHDVMAIKAKVFPYATGKPEDVVGEPLSEELIPRGLVAVLLHENTRYLWVRNFTKHQRVDHPGDPVITKNPAQFVAPELFAEHSRTFALEGSGRDGSGKEGIGEEEAGGTPKQPAPATPPSKTILTFPVIAGKKGQPNGTGREWQLTEAKLQEYQETFAGVDVLLQCKRALQWCRDNPTQRKTSGGMPAFLNRWLTKEQNRAGRGGEFAKAPKPGEAGFTPTPLDYVILAYRKALEIPESDKKAWNAGYWEKLKPDAKAILDYFEGDQKRACGCVEFFVRDFRAKGLTFTLATVMKHAHDYKNRRVG